MLRALRYSLTEAAASLWRRRGSATLAMLTIAAGLFVLGCVAVVHVNLQHLMARWSDAAELSVYLTEDASTPQVQAIGEQLARSGVAAEWRYVSKADAAARFREDFPDLARTADQLDTNPLPASFDVSLAPAARASAAPVEALAATLALAPGVADVRYDGRILARIRVAIRVVKAVGLAIAALLAIAAALTVASVVRLAAHARREEIEVMQLVGAPLAYVRGPFVAEGVLQGGVGALLAMTVLWGVVVASRARLGPLAEEALGRTQVAFLPLAVCVLLVLGGMLLGCIGGFLVARTVR